MTKNFNAVISKEGDWFVAQYLEVDIASQGNTEDEALANLNDALLLHFAPPLASIVPTVRHFELEIAALNQSLTANSDANCSKPDSTRQ